MLEKTKAIVLHQIKYTDSSIIVQLYTKKYGRQAIMVKGLRNRKNGKHINQFQPMFILDLDLYYKASREMQMIREFSVSYTPFDISSNIRKSCVAIFLGEVLTSVLREESPHEDLFDFIEESIIYFDTSTEGYANFHISFLAGLSSFLGFEPSPQTSADDVFFDMPNGLFVPIPPVHGNYAKEEISGILASFFASSYNNSNTISLNGSLRNEVLDTLMKYYSIHLPGLRKIKSLDVLKEVFS